MSFFCDFDACYIDRPHGHGAPFTPCNIEVMDPAIPREEHHAPAPSPLREERCAREGCGHARDAHYATAPTRCGMAGHFCHCHCYLPAPSPAPAESAAPRCTFCGAPATCVGRYEMAAEDEYGCDTCCGHACEDGECRELDAPAAPGPEAPRPQIGGCGDGCEAPRYSEKLQEALVVVERQATIAVVIADRVRALEAKLAQNEEARAGHLDALGRCAAAHDAAVTRAESAEAKLAEVTPDARDEGKCCGFDSCAAYRLELEDNNSDLRTKLAEAERKVEARFDCHAGPGTTEPACGGCVSCLTRALAEAERKRDRLVVRLDEALLERAERGAKRDTALKERDEALARIAALEGALEPATEVVRCANTNGLYGSGAVIAAVGCLRRALAALSPAPAAAPTGGT